MGLIIGRTGSLLMGPSPSIARSVILRRFTPLVRRLPIVQPSVRSVISKRCQLSPLSQIQFQTTRPLTRSFTSSVRLLQAKSPKEAEQKSGLKDVVRLLMLAKPDWKLLVIAITLLTVSCGIGMTIPKVIGMILDVLKTGLETNEGKDGPISMADVPPIFMGYSIYEFLGGFAALMVFGIVATMGELFY